MDKKKALTFFAVETSNEISLPFVGGVKAGFPSPAQDYIDSSIDLNKELIKHPSATFIAKVTGDSLKDAGLDIGDLVLVDKSEPFVHGKMAICFIDGEFTAKYLNLKEKDKGIIWLHSANNKYEPIKVTPENDFVIWGMIIEIIKKPPVMDF
ncbi:translesion error-prone DNA polymerase V autoproteolytic subunit [Dysgonomonas sp. Shenzhen-Wh21]|uniref:LexA family protein n=1 Tax=Dysgonomonas TaxID=156973 RepID=UPI00208DE232|nr:translesion error-prone DNA polymerase V autoproteolytic subunit [Dysgonomonas mossii]